MNRSDARWVGIMAALLAVACTQDVPEQARIQQVGYFKDSSNNRIFTLKLHAAATAAEARAAAEQLANTPGQMMAAYFYAPDAFVPDDAVTLGKDLVSVTDMLYDDPSLPAWRFVFIRNFNAPPSFVDCVEAPDKDLCRK